MDKQQYQIRALRQAEGDNLQLKVVVGLIASLGLAGAINPMAGLILAAWVWYRSAREARESGLNSAAIIDGTFAHSLDEDDFTKYRELVGEDQVQQQLQEAVKRKLPISNHAKQLVKATPVICGAEPMQVEPMQVVEVPKVETIGFDINQLVQPLENMFILGCGGSGKGVLVSNLLRTAQQNDPQLKVFVIDPKGEVGESGYWETCDHVERNQVANMDSTQVIQWLDYCLDKYLSWLAVVEKSGGRGLLIVDELLILGHHSKAARYNRIGSLVISTASLGDVIGRKVWLITQTPYVTGVGLTLTQSSQIPWVCLIGATNPLRQWGKAATLTPIAPDQLQRLKESSPVGRAIMAGDTWYAMPRLTNYSGVDRDTKKSNRGLMPMVLERCKSNPVYRAWEHAVKTTATTTPEDFCAAYNLSCTPTQLELIRECFYGTTPTRQDIRSRSQTDLPATVSDSPLKQKAALFGGGRDT
jgi:hypothetical protein